MQAILEAMRGGLIVSCQALEHEPLYGSAIMSRMAVAAHEGGAVGIRANTPDDIRSIRAAVDLPIIGLWKRDYPDSAVYITPTLREIEAVMDAGADIVAIDATARPRPHGDSLATHVAHVRRSSDALLMADVSTLEEGLEAERLGFDVVSTTLSGYTPYSPQLAGPDFELVGALASRLSIPVVAEGRIQSPEQAARCLASGAFAVVVGGAITRPQAITRRFVDGLSKGAAGGDGG